jgi:RNA polymerase sigma-70 factor (sigma-E family)
MGLPHHGAAARQSAAAGAEVPVDERAVVVTELFHAHYAQLVCLSRFLVDDEETAEDVVMEAFTALYRRWRAIRDPNEAYRYLRSCVLNGARSQLRRRRVVRLHDATSAPPPSGPDVAVAASARATVTALLRTLPLRQRQVLVLRYFLDLSEAEIAEMLQIRPGSVKTHTRRGMAALTHALEAAR